MDRRRLDERDRAGRPGLVRSAQRTDGEVHDAENAVGRSGHLRHVVERRPSGRARPAAGRVRHQGTTLRRGIRQAGQGGQRHARTRELNRVGAFRNDVGTRTFRQTSLVVDPPDGRIPALTPEAQREVDRRQVQRSNPPATWTDRSLYDRCITRGIFGSVLPVIYGNGNFIFQSPGIVVDHLRDGARHAHHPARRPPAHQPGHPAVHGRRPRALRGRHARGGDHQLHRQHHRRRRQRRRRAHERRAARRSSASRGWRQTC